MYYEVFHVYENVKCEKCGEFENKLRKMALKELQTYGKLLDEKIKQRISANESTKKIAALILYRGILDYEIKSRIASEKE